MRHACHKPRDQGARGRQGEEGKGGCREGTARTGTRRRRAKDPGAWESGRGRTRGTHPRGAGLGQSTGVEGGGKDGGLPRELLRPVLARAERATRETYAQH